jgi:hypothetical protein
VPSGGEAETIVERPTALDVHSEHVTACARARGQGRARERDIAAFRTTVLGLLTLRDWLEPHGATQVTTEATGVY